MRPRKVETPGAERRPWGSFAVLADEKDHKVKRLVVLPGKRLSLQRHRFRTEHWHVLFGEGTVTKGKKEIRVEPGVSVDIPAGTFHRVMNTGTGDLVIIEVQRGEYFGEDDIERIEDDFGRA
ncbi:MAG: phosphomannose isomerase type II C-terminal cupin domain [Deltaproteobacteria bacterium]|nr:phosphomannose isomerase type II C-terminal cupin domain [Deltaproteobacteria bacterium]